MMEWIRKHKIIFFIVLLFGLIYSSISLVNHYNFRTYALDLGAYTNALYDYARLQWNNSTVFKEVAENLLADHFDLYLIIFSPFSYLFGTYTLLIIQLLALLGGGIGVYFFFLKIKTSKRIACLAAVYFYSFFSVFSAISYDYHSNVVAAAMMPWLFYAVASRKFLMSAILILFGIVAKENISLWLVFICIGLAIEYRKDVYLRTFLLTSALFCAICFLLITTVFMPAMANQGVYPHFHYSYLGQNYSEAILHLISNPIDSLKVLFINHNNQENGDFVKAELHVFLLTSGLFFLLKKPQFILMLLPIYFQKLFHDSPSMWSIGGQYSIEFAPILAIGIFKVIAELKSNKLAVFLAVFAVLLTILTTIRSMDRTIAFTDKTRVRFYKKAHYQNTYEVAIVHEQLSRIPDNAVVSALSPFLPHLALRDDIYEFPIIKNAEYIVYSLNESPYPLSELEFDHKINEIVSSGEWDFLYNGDIVILKRKHLPVSS